MDEEGLAISQLSEGVLFKRASFFRILFAVSVFICSFYPKLATASDTIPATDPPVSTSSVVPGPLSPFVNYAQTGNFSLTNQQLGWYGPLSFGVTHSDLTGTYANGQYVQPLGQFLAFAALGEYGSDQYRINGTLGYSITPLSQIKLTAERFSQRLPFQFDSGDVDEKVHQDAYGGRFQQLFNFSFLQGLNFGGYYAEADNESLDPIIFTSDGSNCSGVAPGLLCINYRNIAGGISSGGDAGADVLLSPWTLVSGNIYYDQVHYNTAFSSTSDEDREGVGGGVIVNQLLGGHWKVMGEATLREVYDTYQAQISWLPGWQHLGMEFSLTGQHITSHNDTPDNNSVNLQVSFLPDGSKTYDQRFRWGCQRLDNIAQWVQEPAVHMNQVLAITDQSTRLWQDIVIPIVGPVVIESITPDSGDVEGGTVVTITGTNLSGVTSVTFDGIPGTNLTIINDTTITVVVPARDATGPVDVVVTGPGGNATLPGGFTYTAQVGDSLMGGIVYSIDGGGPTGTSGHIVSSTDVSTVPGGTIRWTNLPFSIPGATSTTNGVANTDAIVADPLCTNNTGQCAAFQCRALGAEWYLPAEVELISVASNLCSGGTCIAGNFQNTFYWSSTQSSPTQALTYLFPSSGVSPLGKDFDEHARCVRPFSPS